MIETKAVKASEEEILENARSRSARMRGIKKLVEEVA
jgi:16S rRNA C1402 N4-methylase RsmH